MCGPTRTPVAQATSATVLALLPVSIVIPTRDRPELLRQTVQSVLDGDSLPAELIVVDQSSRPTQALPARDGVDIRHLELATRGLSRARNAGIAAATYDVIVMIDDDVRVQPDWLRRLVDALLAAPARTVVTGTVAAPPTTMNGFVPSTTSRTEPETFCGRQAGDYLFGGNMAMRRALSEEVGPFDERLGAGSTFASAEDNDWGYRLLEAGAQIAFVPEAVLHHYGTRQGRELFALDWAYGRGQGAFYAKHMSLSDRHILGRFRRDGVLRLRRVARIVRGKRRGLREGIYLAGLVSGALGWWRRSAGRAIRRL